MAMSYSTWSVVAEYSAAQALYRFRESALRERFYVSRCGIGWGLYDMVQKRWREEGPHTSFSGDSLMQLYHLALDILRREQVFQQQECASYYASLTGETP